MLILIPSSSPFGIMCNYIRLITPLYENTHFKGTYVRNRFSTLNCAFPPEVFGRCYGFG